MVPGLDSRCGCAVRWKRRSERCRSRTRSGFGSGTSHVADIGRILAAPTGPMPWMSIKWDPAARTATLSSTFTALSLTSRRSMSAEFLGSRQAPDLPRLIPRPQADHQRLVLGV